VDLELTGKRAFVTGGTRGIGLAIAHALAAEGASVAVCGRDQDSLEQAVKAIRDDGTEACGVRADITEPDQLQAAIDIGADYLDGLDLLVANAGGSVGGDLLESTPQDWVDTYALNVLHAAHAVRVSVPHFEKAGRGAVVITSSISGWKPGSKSSYGTAKAAEIHLAAALAEELAGRNVRVNSVSPGSVHAEGNSWDRFNNEHPDQMAEFARREFPGGRLLTVNEVADVTCFLLSDRAAGVNGANICVDGGQGRPGARRFF
jgi:3-oxoacyl-[acyl-carrier protein] reductase